MKSAQLFNIQNFKRLRRLLLSPNNIITKATIQGATFSKLSRIIPTMMLLMITN